MRQVIFLLHNLIYDSQVTNSGDQQPYHKCGEGDNMETRVIVEKPLIVLQSSCAFSDEGEYIEIYAAELKAAEVGKRWVADYCDNGRANECESLEVVYKAAKGIALLYRRWGTTDADMPQSWEDDPQLWWVETSSAE